MCMGEGRVEMIVRFSTISHRTLPHSHISCSALPHPSLLPLSEVPWERERGGGGNISLSPLFLVSSGGLSNLVTRGCSLRLYNLWLSRRRLREGKEEEKRAGGRGEGRGEEEGRRVGRRGEGEGERGEGEWERRGEGEGEEGRR